MSYRLYKITLNQDGTERPSVDAYAECQGRAIEANRRKKEKVTITSDTSTLFKYNKTAQRASTFKGRCSKAIPIQKGNP